MIDPERLAAFALMTGVTSLVPGLSMLFVMAQTMRSGWRSGALSLAGMQIGYALWWVLAALGLGTLAAAWPLAFKLLAIAGAGYLGWLGVQAIVHAGAESASAPRASRRHPTQHAFGDGIVVALSNPKSLVYIVAMLPPFVDRASPVVPQLIVFWIVGMILDVAIGALYIGAGDRMAEAVRRADVRRRIDLAVGAVYLVIAFAVLADSVLR